jgi:hypothetical protein
MRLPAELRARFENDPAKLIEFIDNSENLDEAINLGLVNKPENLPQVVEDTQEKAAE